MQGGCEGWSRSLPWWWLRGWPWSATGFSSAGRMEAAVVRDSVGPSLLLSRKSFRWSPCSQTAPRLDQPLLAEVVIQAADEGLDVVGADGKLELIADLANRFDGS